MSYVWDTLTEICNTFIETFETNGTEVFESGMEQFNRPGWVNRVWQGEKFRRAHVDVVDARDTRGLWMMHTCIFPHLTNDGPIFGFDVIAGKNKITGCFHDWSATQNLNHVMLENFRYEAEQLEWTKKRELPDWAKAIFSNNMVSAGNVQHETELDQIAHLADTSVRLYLNDIANFNEKGQREKGVESQNRYAYYQKQNPHTPRTMSALGLPEDDVDTFIQNCLFPDIE